MGGAGCGAGSGAEPQQLVKAVKAARLVPRRASFRVVLVLYIEEFGGVVSYDSFDSK